MLCKIVYVLLLNLMRLIECGTALVILIINPSHFWRQIYYPLDTVKTQMVSNIGKETFSYDEYLKS